MSLRCYLMSLLLALGGANAVCAQQADLDAETAVNDSTPLAAPAEDATPINLSRIRDLRPRTGGSAIHLRGGVNAFPETLELLRNERAGLPYGSGYEARQRGRGAGRVGRRGRRDD
jgi:hypothetical protein